MNIYFFLDDLNNADLIENVADFVPQRIVLNGDIMDVITFEQGKK